MKLSVLMPVWNEEVGLAEILARVVAVQVPKEIIVVDDCSTDSTAHILEQINIPDLRVIRHPVNRGKGAAIRTALEAATGDAVIIQDADLEYDPRLYRPASPHPARRGQSRLWRSRSAGSKAPFPSRQPATNCADEPAVWRTVTGYGDML